MKKQTVDTPFVGSWADEQKKNKSSNGLVDPRTLPVQFQEEQRRRNIEIRLGSSGYSQEDAKRAEQWELKEFPKS